MTSRGSLLAYDEIRVSRPTAHWHCLVALAEHPVPGTTARVVRKLINKRGVNVNQRNAESRLCELVRLKLAWEDPDGDERYTCYWLTVRGWLTLRMGETGMQILRNLNNRMKVLEDKRRVTLAPLKAACTAHIERELSRASDEVFAQPVLGAEK